MIVQDGLSGSLAETSPVIPWWQYRPITGLAEKAVVWVAVVVAMIALATLFSSLFSGGRLGFVGVNGNSMQDTFVSGSSVFVVPTNIAHDGDFVVAWASQGADGASVEDAEAGFVIKRYRSLGSKVWLEGTTDGSRYSKFELRGKVVAAVATQRICWWRDTGAQKAVRITLPDEAERDFVKKCDEAIATIAEKKKEWIKSKCKRSEIVVEDKLEKKWTHKTERFIYLVEIAAETPFSISLHQGGRMVKDAMVCAPSSNDLVAIYATRNTPLTGAISLVFDEQSLNYPTKLYRVVLWESADRL